MADHVQACANENGWTWKHKPNMAGMMYVEFGYFEGPTIETEADYMVNLHELGHMYYGHTQGRPPCKDKTFYFDNGVLHSEAQAWDYALLEGSWRISPKTARFIWNTCFNSYWSHAKQVGYSTPGQRLWNGNRHHVSFAFGEPTPLCYDVKRRMQSLQQVSGEQPPE